ncbi:MAG: exonuclease domain-containing protein [Bacteroidota bacterium]
MYAIVDIETTGGHAGNHRITEVAILHHDGRRVTDRYKTLINPERDIPPFITALTGIDADMVKDAPLFGEIAEELLERLQDRVFVAHNAQFDYGFLKREFEQAGLQWNTRRLCTVRLSRKIIPGLRSYSLGQLSDHLSVRISGRHRAWGDAEATARIFSILHERDTAGEIEKALKRNSGDMVLPPNLSREVFDQLPHAAGVYYFHDARGKVIYVGKARDIRKRIAGHFTGIATEWNRSNIRSQIHHISFERTGNELVALIHEALEIQRLWPKFNLAQKGKAEVWGIFDYTDRAGFIRFSLNPVARGTSPLFTAASKGDVWNTMWELVREYELCPRLSGLQKTDAACHSHTIGECRGACAGKEKPAAYNKRATKAIAAMKETGETYAIIGEGRDGGEHSVVLVKEGRFTGFGFMPADAAVSTLEEAEQYIKPVRENRLVNGLVASWVENGSGGEVITF